MKWIAPYFLVVDVNPLRSDTKHVTSSFKNDLAINVSGLFKSLFVSYIYVNYPSVYNTRIPPPSCIT